MTKHRVVVTDKRQERLPDWAASYVALITRMRQQGMLDEIAERLRVPRQGGYSDIDIVMFLLCFLCSGLQSQKEFGDRSKPYRVQLAALADRKQLPAPSSTSRYLGSASTEQVQPFVDWLLLSGVDATLLAHEYAGWRDSRGKLWSVFDWDPSVLTMRRRGLPDKESLPEASRRSAAAEPGYSGRKRGEVQLCRSIITHAGTAQPVGLMVQPGNGHFRQLCTHAADAVRRAADEAGLARRRTVMRADGIGGCVPFIRICQQAGVRYLARLSRYRWLEADAVTQLVEAGCFEQVVDSGSGPVREALDLGWVRIHADRRSQTRDAQPYEPVRARVIVTRFKPSEQHSYHQAGRRIGEYCYEMFVTDLDADSWPAAEAVALYFGRAGCENYYAQLNREHNLDQLFSQQPAGQLLVSALALWLFGEQARLGRQLDDGAQPVDRAQKPRQPASSRRAHLGRNRSQADAEISGPDTYEGADILKADQIEEVLERFDDGWRWDRSIQGFVCWRDQPLTARKIRRSRLVFSPTRTACRGCPFRQPDSDGHPVCTESTNPDFRKEVSVKLDDADFERIELDKLKELRPSPKIQLHIEPITTDGGPWHMAPPSLFPARWRRAFRRACQDVEVEVELHDSADSPPPVRPIAEIRQRRRLSWEQRHRRGALRGKTVELTVRGGDDLKQFFSTLDPSSDSHVIEIAS